MVGDIADFDFAEFAAWPAAGRRGGSSCVPNKQSHIVCKRLLRLSNAILGTRCIIPRRNLEPLAPPPAGRITVAPAAAQV